MTAAFMSAATAALLGSHLYGMTVEGERAFIPNEVRATVVDQRRADVEIAVTETISVSDAVLSDPALPLKVVEAIFVTDEANARAALHVDVSEEITVVDEAQSGFPLEVIVTEPIIVSEAVRPTIAVQIAISEAIVVSDSSAHTFEGSVSAEEDEVNVPASYALSDAYPNPFNPSSTIRFELPEPAHVRVTIYDALGRVVQRLVDDEFAPGAYEIMLDASSLASGTYFYRMQAGSFDETKSIFLSK